MVEVAVVFFQRLLSVYGMFEISMSLKAFNLVCRIMSKVIFVNLLLSGRSHVVIVVLGQNLPNAVKFSLPLVP